MSAQNTLFEAVQAGDLGRVRDMLSKMPELATARNEQGISALMMACYCRHEPVVAALVEHGVQPDVFEAAALGLKDHVAALLEKDASLVNTCSPDGFSPLGLAAFFGHPDVVALLIGHGADVNAPSRNAMQVRPLHSALAHRRPDVALQMTRQLLEAGAEVNAGQRGGLTPMHQAAAYGRMDLIRLLLRYGAYILVQADDGRTPIDMALAGGHGRVAQFLKASILIA